MPSYDNDKLFRAARSFDEIYAISDIQYLTPEEENQKLRFLQDATDDWAKSILSFPFIQKYLRARYAELHSETSGELSSFTPEAVLEKVSLGSNTEQMRVTKLNYLAGLVKETFAEIERPMLELAETVLTRGEVRTLLSSNGPLVKRLGSLLVNNQEADIGRYVAQGEQKIGTDLSDGFRQFDHFERVSRVREELRNDLVPYYTRFVVGRAAAFQKIHPEHLLEDLVQVGLRGLMEGVERFSPEYGTRLLTYAGQYIFLHLNNYHLDSNVVRIPKSVHAPLAKMQKFINEFKGSYRRTPADEEIAKALKISSKLVASLRLAFKAKQQKAHTVNNGPSDLEYDLPHKVSVSGTVKLSNHTDLVVGRRVISHILTEQDKKILDLRFGLDGSVPLTCKQAAAVLQISRESVRKAEISSLRKVADWFTLLDAPKSDVEIAFSTLAPSSTAVVDFWKARKFLTRAKEEEDTSSGINFFAADRLVSLCADGVKVIATLQGLSTQSKTERLGALAKSKDASEGGRQSA